MKQKFIPFMHLKLESENVCMYVFPEPGDFKMMDFCTLAPWGLFFTFQNFDSWGSETGSKRSRLTNFLGQPWDFKNDRIWLKFYKLVPWMNISSTILYFLSLDWKSKVVIICNYVENWTYVWVLWQRLSNRRWLSWWMADGIWSSLAL